MSSELDFSIIIATYERPGPLARCLGAIARLRYPHDRFEVIVVDDGSLQPIAEVAAPFRSAMELAVLSIPNAGPARARNLGAERARGGTLAFTDDDCTPNEGWLDGFRRRGDTAPEAALGGRTVNALADNLCSALSQMVVEVAYGCYNAEPGDARFFASNNLAVPAARFRALGGFDAGFRTAEDRDFCERWRRRGGRLVYAPEAVVQHAHPLTLFGLWRQHFAYGRGAYHFHCRHRHWRRLEVDRGFYRDLALRPFASGSFSRGAVLACLLALQQGANVAGFFTEMLQAALGVSPYRECRSRAFPISGVPRGGRGSGRAALSEGRRRHDRSCSDCARPSSVSG